MFEFVYICVYTFSRMIYNLLTRYIVFQLELMKLLTLSYIFQLLVRLIYFPSAIACSEYTSSNMLITIVIQNRIMWDLQSYKCDDILFVIIENY